MKKLILTVLVAVAILSPVFVEEASATMDDRDFTVSVIGTATGTVSYVLRGELEGIYIDIAAGSTQTVTLASSEQTLFTKAGVASDVWYSLRYPQYGSTGSALESTGATTNTVYGKAPLAGDITLTVIGAAGTTATNSTTVTAIYLK